MERNKTAKERQVAHVSGLRRRCQSTEDGQQQLLCEVVRLEQKLRPGAPRRCYTATAKREGTR